MQTAATLSIFAATLALVVLRPKGLNEAWFTVLGGSAVLVFGLEPPAKALAIVDQSRDALLFLLGLLVLADLMRASGFFEWVAIHAARSARGRGHALFRNVFLLGAGVTALLSLDTTAVMLTPVVLAIVGRLELKPRPFLFTCAFIANTGSLLLKVSNLTNLLYAGDFGWGFGAFTARMFLPQMLALAVNFVIFRRLFRASLPAQYSEDELPAPKEVVPDERFFRASIAVFSVVVVGYAIGDLVHVPAYAFAIAGAAVLLGIGLCLRRVKIGILREVSWSVFPFVVGLFFVVGALENLGLSVFVTRALSAGAHSKILAVVVGVFGAGVGSNLVNNIPMALLATSSVKHGDDLTRYATLLGCNLGPNLTVTGSLATMLVIATARKQGEKIGAKDFFKVGLITTPALLAAGALGLLATGVFFR